jgi:hypothetical protein
MTFATGAELFVAEVSNTSDTPNDRYFHFRHLMKILVLIRRYHRTYLNLFSLILTYFTLILTYVFDTSKGLELIIRRSFIFIYVAKTIEYKKSIRG